MPIRLADLILRVPADVERRVRETSTRHGPALREAIRSECGFLLQAKRDTDSRRIGAQVPVTVKAGLPASLEDVGFTDDFERVLVIGRHRSAIEKLRDGGRALGSLRDELSGMSDAERWAPGETGALEPLRAWAEMLLRYLDSYDPLKRMLSV